MWAAKTKETYHTTVSIASVFQESLEKDERYQHLKSPFNIQTITDAIKELKDASEKDAPGGGTWRDWLHGEQQDLKKDKGERVFMSQAQMVSKVIDPLVTKLNVKVNQLKDQHTRSLAANDVGTKKIKRTRKT